MTAPENTRERLAEALRTATWPDGGTDGFPSTKVAGMLVDALLPLIDTLLREQAEGIAAAIEALPGPGEVGIKRWPVMAQENYLLAIEEAATAARTFGGEHEGCDCTELCSMGPTCPGGMLARLPGSGCWRTKDGAIGAVVEQALGEHAPTTHADANVSCRPPCGWTGNDFVQHRAHQAAVVSEAIARTFGGER